MCQLAPENVKGNADGARRTITLEPQKLTDVQRRSGDVPEEKMSVLCVSGPTLLTSHTGQRVTDLLE